MIFAFLARLGVPQRLIGPLLGLGAVLLLGLCAGLWLHFHDRKVIDNHEAGIERKVTKATNAANDVATTNDTKRQADNARGDEQLRGTIDHAQAANPEAAQLPAGPVTSATLDRLRARQAKARPSAR